VNTTTHKSGSKGSKRHSRIEVDIRLSYVLLHIVSLADLTGFWHLAGYTAQGSLNLRYPMMPPGLAQHNTG
jgi:hypothetical protein